MVVRGSKGPEGRNSGAHEAEGGWGQRGPPARMRARTFPEGSGGHAAKVAWRGRVLGRLLRMNWMCRQNIQAEMCSRQMGPQV